MQRLKPQLAQVRGVKFYMQAGQDITVGGRISSRRNTNTR